MSETVAKAIIRDRDFKLILATLPCIASCVALLHVQSRFVTAQDLRRDFSPLDSGKSDVPRYYSQPYIKERAEKYAVRPDGFKKSGKHNMK